MLKIIITTLLVTTSFSIFGSEYLVQVSDEVTNESLTLKVSSNNELDLLLNEINTRDNLKIHSIKSGMQLTDAVRGGEGGTD